MEHRIEGTPRTIIILKITVRLDGIEDVILALTFEIFITKMRRNLILKHQLI